MKNSALVAQLSLFVSSNATITHCTLLGFYNMLHHLKGFIYSLFVLYVWALYDNRDSSHNCDIYIYSRIVIPQNFAITPYKIVDI